MALAGSSRSYPVRLLLLGFALAVVAPLLVLLGYLLYQSAESERAHVESRLQRVALNLTDDIERDFDRRIALLQTLATSPLVTAKSWQAFYQQASAALKGQAYLVLTDAAGRQLVNTYVPFGTEPLYTGDPETVTHMRASRQPVISNLFVSLVVKKPVVNISIPVIRDGDVQYVMSLGLLPEDFLAVLTAQRLDPQWVLSIWDRNDMILARTRNHDAYVGKPLPARLRAAQWPNGVSRSSSLDDEAVVRAVATSPRSRWRVSVSVPVALAESSLRWTMGLLGAVTAFGLLLVGVFAFYGGRLVSEPLVKAAATARAIGTGQNIEPTRTYITEVNDLVSALKDASERQHLLSQELNHRCKNILTVVQSIVSRSLDGGRSPSEARSVTSQRLQALARAQDLMLKHDWLGADLREIAKNELDPFGGRVEINGPPLVVPPELLQPLMLVFHELATNAVKYGALSTLHGRVQLSWTVTSDSSKLRLVWQESGGPKVAVKSRKGFGSRLLEHGVPHGVAIFDYDPAGFVYKLEVDLPETIIGHDAKSTQSDERDAAMPSATQA